MKKLIIIVALSLTLVIIGSLLYWLKQNKTITINSLRLTGHIETTMTDLSFNIPGRVAAIGVEEGEYVIIGQVLARLEDQDLSQEVAVAEASLAATKINLEKLKIGNRPQEIKSAESAFTSAQTNLADKTRDFQRQQELFKYGATTKSLLEKTQTYFELATELTHRAAESLSLAREGYRREDIFIGTAELNLARAKLELARTKLSFTTLNAPTTGIVLTRNIEPGEIVTIGTPVLTIADLDQVWLEVYLPASELGKIHLGDIAKITTDSYSDKYYQGRVSFIASKAEFTPKIVETPKERTTLVFRAKIIIDNPKHELKPGMPGEALILFNMPISIANENY